MDIKQMIILNIFFIFLFLCNAEDDKIIYSNHTERSKRQLLFSANCVLQFAVGIAVPSMLSYRKIAANGGILLNLELPTNLSHFSSPYTRSQKLSQFKLLETMHNLSGMDVHSCIQKSKCQLKETPFNGDDMFQQIFQALFGPKKNKQLNTNQTMGSNCDSRYPLCPVSIVDFLTEIYET
ncbi:uncharacterized protein LOC142323927 [Lycorma delicatula]|uniref:uncharacterized protein LOC142323927 n=1 Tax=Lycorma delicatula TaxID=130591 RepID=UPI003F511926